MSWRNFNGTVNGVRKILKPEVSIVKTKNAVGETRFFTKYRYHYTGVYAPCLSVEDAFKWLKHYAEEDGFLLDDCKFTDESEYFRNNLIQPELF